MMRPVKALLQLVDKAVASVVMACRSEEKLHLGITYTLECRAPDGTLRWKEVVTNVVCGPGKNDLLDKYLAGSAYTAAWFLILAGAGTKASTDTLASHAGWSEVTPYTGNRPAISWNAASGSSKSSTATSVAITAAGPTTVAGSGLASVNTGTSGILFSVADFSASRSVYLGDTLQVTSVVGA